MTISTTFENDNIFFAQARDALYRSTDGGDTWKQVSNLPGTVGSMALSPGFENDRTVFAFRAYDPHRVYRSTDGGVTWKQVLDRYALSIAISPAFETDRTLFATTAMNDVYGVYRSTNGGDTWEQVNGGLAYNWATKPAFIMGVGFALLLGGAILFTRYTGGLRSITWWWRVLWLAAGLEVGILLLTTSYTLGAPALLVRGFNLQLLALVGLGFFILALLVVGFVPSIGTVLGSRVSVVVPATVQEGIDSSGGLR